MAELSENEREALVEGLAPDLYTSVMEVTADQWRRWEYLTDAAKETSRREAGRIVADALAAAVEQIVARHTAAAVTAALNAAADEITQALFTAPEFAAETGRVSGVTAARIALDAMLTSNFTP